ncbi:hypothetical protein AHF37_06318 [Paragonimus kellicotti]|nr:hypothetical protein AHF37_06318 [Paragonimus kellicotti]
MAKKPPRPKAFTVTGFEDANIHCPTGGSCERYPLRNRSDSVRFTSSVRIY